MNSQDVPPYVWKAAQTIYDVLLRQGRAEPDARRDAQRWVEGNYGYEVVLPVPAKAKREAETRRSYSAADAAKDAKVAEEVDAWLRQERMRQEAEREREEAYPWLRQERMRQQAAREREDVAAWLRDKRAREQREREARAYTERLRKHEKAMRDQHRRERRRARAAKLGKLALKTAIWAVIIAAIILALMKAQ